MTQICKKFAVMKPSMWMILHTVQFMTTSNPGGNYYVNNRRAQRPEKQ